MDSSTKLWAILAPCVSVAVIGGSVAIIYFMKKRRDSKLGVCRVRRDLTGQVCIVTGANTGLGLEVTVQLAAQNATVVMACRDIQRATAAKNVVMQRTKTMSGEPIKDVSGQVHIMHLDLGSLKSVEAFTEDFKQRFDRLDILVNNAGIMAHPYTLSVDGLELHMAVNYVSHFHLCNLLLDRLQTESRIINVSSGYYSQITDFEHLLDTNYRSAIPPPNWRPTIGYAASKCAQCLHTVELAKRLNSADVSVYAVRPGFVRNTELGRHMNRALVWLAAPLIWYVSRNIVQGSQTILHCAFADKKQLKSGALYNDCAFDEYTSVVTEANARRFWDLSHQMVAESGF